MPSGLRKIASYADPIEAEMACELLKSHGIAAEMAGGTSVSVFGAGHPLSAQFVVVDASQAAEARALLAGQATVPAPAAPAEAPERPGKRLDGYYEATWNEREKAAESAYRAAIVGWFVPLVSWWALWLLLFVFSSDLPLNSRCARRAKIATAVMAVPATLCFVIVVLVVTQGF